MAMNEPLLDCKRDAETLYVRPTSTFGAKSTTAEYRHAVEQALRFRRPAAVMIDEAQHLSKMASGRRLLDQLDVVKSIANQTRIVHVLFGTYDLLSFRNLNGQLSRRSLDVHFPRYRAESASERQVFVNVLGSFANHMPLPEQPDLAGEWEFLYERSIGCIGILKQWLTRALHSVLRRNGNTIVRKDLEAQALSVMQCEAELVSGPRSRTHHRRVLQEREAIRNDTAIRGCHSRSPLAVQFTRHHRPRRSSSSWLAHSERAGVPVCRAIPTFYNTIDSQSTLSLLQRTDDSDTTQVLELWG